MDARVLRAGVRPPVGTRRADGRHVRSAPVPEAADVVPLDNLRQATCLDMPDLDETAVEEEDVRRVPGDAFGCPFPFDCTDCATWVTVSIDVQAEF